MTTREIYFKNLILSDLPSGLIGYTYKDKNNVIQIGNYIAFKLQTDKSTVEDSLKKMKEIEKIDGFMFWNSSR